MSAAPDQFDVEAAWLRRSQGDLRAFMEALAVRLEGALPSQVSVERRRDGLLSKTNHVAKIEVKTDTAIHSLSLTKGGLAATRAKVIRGVAISTSSLPVADWLSQVRAEAQVMAERTVGAAEALRDFL